MVSDAKNQNVPVLYPTPATRFSKRKTSRTTRRTRSGIFSGSSATNSPTKETTLPTSQYGTDIIEMALTPPLS